MYAYKLLIIPVTLFIWCLILFVLSLKIKQNKINHINTTEKDYSNTIASYKLMNDFIDNNVCCKGGLCKTSNNQNSSICSICINLSHLEVKTNKD